MTTVPRAGLREALALTRAWVWLVLGRPERGLGVLERALGRGAHGMLHRHRAGLLSLLGRRDEALEALQAALRFDPLDGTTRIEAVETLVRWGWDKDRIVAFMDESGGPVEGNKRSVREQTDALGNERSLLGMSRPPLSRVPSPSPQWWRTGAFPEPLG